MKKQHRGLGLDKASIRSLRALIGALKGLNKAHDKDLEGLNKPLIKGLHKAFDKALRALMRPSRPLRALVAPLGPGS